MSLDLGLYEPLDPSIAAGVDLLIKNSLDHAAAVLAEHMENRGLLFSRNITHNLGAMADAAGIYKCLWRPDENWITKARQMIAPLGIGLADLQARPEFFAQFNSPNGWGMYEHFVPFVQAVLNACEEHPDADVRVSR